MKTKALILAGLLIVPLFAFSSAPAQDATIVTGEVVRYAPGELLVVRSYGRETTYMLTPSLIVPAEVQVGRNVSLHLEPGAGGATTVTRVTTTSITPEGQVKETTEETRTKLSGETTKVTTVTVQGKVEAYQPGETITVMRSDGTKTTYVINETAQIPMELAVGKTVTIRTLPTATVPTVETIIID
jgi:hypothetical protein